MHEISSTLARQLIDDGRSTEGVLTHDVRAFLDQVLERYKENGSDGN
jgi:hypothetical protein